MVRLVRLGTSVLTLICTEYDLNGMYPRVCFKLYLLRIEGRVLSFRNKLIDVLSGFCVVSNFKISLYVLFIKDAYYNNTHLKSPQIVLKLNPKSLRIK